MKPSDWLQILTILAVTFGVVFEFRTHAHWGYILLTAAPYIWAFSEKIKKRGK